MSCAPKEGSPASLDSNALLPLMASSPAGAVMSSIITLSQPSKQEQPIASLPRYCDAVQHSDPTVKCLFGASTPRSEQERDMYIDSVPLLKAVSEEHQVTQDPCSEGEIYKNFPSHSPFLRVPQLKRLSIDTLQYTSCMLEDGAEAHSTLSQAAPIPTFLSHYEDTKEADTMSNRLLSSSTKNDFCLWRKGDVDTTTLFADDPCNDRAVDTLDTISSTMTSISSGLVRARPDATMAATWRASSSLVNATSSGEAPAGSTGCSVPHSPLTPGSVPSQPVLSIRHPLERSSQVNAWQRACVGGRSTTMAAATTTAAAAAGPSPHIPLSVESCVTSEGSGAIPILLQADAAANTYSKVSEEATAPVASDQRRKKRRPPSLFTGGPTTAMSTAVPTQLALPLPIPHQLADDPPASPAVPATTTTTVPHPTVSQETQGNPSVSGANRSLPGPLHRLSSLPQSTLVSPRSSSTALISLVLPATRGSCCGDEDHTDGRKFTAQEAGEDAQGQAEAFPTLQQPFFPPMQVTPFAVSLAIPSTSGEPCLPACPNSAQQHQARSEDHESLSGSGLVMGNTLVSNSPHNSAVGAISLAGVSPDWLLPSAAVTHHRLPKLGPPSPAGEDVGGIAASRETPTVSNTSLSGLANHYGAGSTSGGNAPTPSLITSALATGANRLQPLSAGRPSGSGTGGGSGVAPVRVISPLFLFGGATATPTARRRIPPPLLVRIRSPVAVASSSTTARANEAGSDMASPGVAAPCSTSSRKAAAVGTPPVRSSFPCLSRSTTLMNSSGTIDVVGTTADRSVRGSGGHLPATPARSGPRLSSRHRNTNGRLVRISHDRRTLVAGIFRVSRDGCLTVRNMLLLNPTRIDAGGVTGGGGIPVANGLCMGGSTHLAAGGAGGGNEGSTLQLLHPQQSAMNCSHVSSSCGLAGRTQLMGLGGSGCAGGVPGLTTPVTTGSDCYSPQAYCGSGGVANARTPRNTSGVGGGVSTNANASFTLFSTSMDTPFSPITYSMDSQRLAPPSPLGGQGDRAGAATGPQPKLLRAARDDTIAALQFPGASSTVPQQMQQHHQGLLHGALRTTELTASPNRPPGGGTPSGGGTAAAQNQVITPNTTTTIARPPGALGGNLHRPQLRPLVSGAGFSGPPGVTNSTSPSALPTTGNSTGTMLGTGTSAFTCMASSLLLPYADIATWRGGMSVSNEHGCGGSPGVPPNGSGGGGRSAAATATPAATSTRMTACTPGMSHNMSCAPLPPNVVLLRDLDILSTPVGEGASATVFVAIHKPTGRRLAVKRVDLSPLCLGSSSPYLRSGAASNGRISQLQHIVVRELQVLHLTYRSPFMVKVYNAFFIAEVAALDIVMEFMHYGSLDHLARCLQKHARMAREPQPERSRLFAGDHGGHDVGGVGEGGSPHVPPLLSEPRLMDLSLKDALALGGRKPSPGVGLSGGERQQSLALVTNRLHDFRSTVVERVPPMVPRRLGAIETCTGGDLVSAADEAGVSSNPPPGCYKHIDDSDDGLLHDSYSVKSDLGVDELESDDGSGLVEELLGVTERLVAVVGEQLLRGVRDMHSRGYIHDDIKPGNVLVNEHGVVKLSDFGLSKRCDDSGASLTNPTLTYIPPVSIAPTRSNTPLQSPSMTSFQLTGARGHRTPLVLNAQHGSTGGGVSGLLSNEVVSTTPPEIASPREGLTLGNTIHSGLPHSDGMDVLETASTSSEEGVGSWCAAGRGKGGRRPSSSSSEGNQGCSGTDRYMSPERHRGEPHGKPADIWAVGVTLAEFAIGEYPYDLTDTIDEFDRVSRMEKSVDVLMFNKRRAMPLSSVFADFCRLATLPSASQRPTAQELLEHPFFKQWHRPFNLKDYLLTRVPVPSNRMKEDYLAKQRQVAQEGQGPATSPEEEAGAS